MTGRVVAFAALLAGPRCSTWRSRVRSWTFAGQAVGDHLFPYRVVVLDYPKR